jgi:hypothetical protein
MKNLILAAMLLTGATGVAFADSEGAAGGAVSGAVGGAIVGGPVGAVVGGVGGAAVGGAVTGPDHRTTVIERDPACSSTTVTKENEMGDRKTVRTDRC